MSPVFAAPEAGWPLHGIAASRAAEAVALAASAPHLLMQHAGLSVARLALALAPHAGRIDVLAGPGNNGGDGLVAAMHLHHAGKAVRVTLLADPARLPDDAADALRRAQDAGVAIVPTLAKIDGDLVIDALLGLGSRRAPEGVIAAAITRCNASGAPVLAVDLPSGLHAETGQSTGGVLVQATATLSLLTLKPGLFTGVGRDACGAVWFDALGMAAAGSTAQLAAAPVSTGRRHATHKGSFGDVAIVGGAAGMVGAAWLSASAALAAGAGRVYCSLLDAQAPLLLTQRPELMARQRWWTARPEVLAATTVVCGCGGGAAVAEALPALLAHAGRLVLDADALNAIAKDMQLQALLRARGTRSTGGPNGANDGALVLTPHPLEAARLLGVGAAAVQADRLAAAQQLAEQCGGVVVLKGSGSIVAAPGRLPTINPTGNALLASAGTGDVLAGWLAGLWAASAARGGSGHDAALAAVWQHGHAADTAAAAGQRHPLLAADLIDRLRGTRL